MLEVRGPVGRTLDPRYLRTDAASTHRLLYGAKYGLSTQAQASEQDTCVTMKALLGETWVVIAEEMGAST